MALLLDTHAYLWFIAGDERLPKRARERIADPNADLVFSVASLSEIAIKHSLGKLDLTVPFAAFVTEQIRRDDLHILPIRTAHLVEMTGLPFHHRDPFDRLIVAQAIAEDVPVMTQDPQFRRYPVEAVWG